MGKFQISNFKFQIILLLAFYILHSTFYTSSAYAQGDGIGESRIHPASPLYFLKSVREALELKFAGTTRVRAYRQLEFATRRLREVKSLVQVSRQDLIQPTLERYWWHLGELKGIIALRDEIMVGQVSESVTQYMKALQTVYDQISDEGAKRSVRATVYRLSEWDQWLIEKLGSVSETAFIQQIAASKLLGCNFLSQEASSSSLNEVEKGVYLERAERCRESSPPAGR